jgi:hypothetical protein
VASAANHKWEARYFDCAAFTRVTEDTSPDWRIPPASRRKLVDPIGATNLGAEMDPSHLRWQGTDVVASIGAGSSARVPSDAPDKVPTGPAPPHR